MVLDDLITSDINGSSLLFAGLGAVLLTLAMYLGNYATNIAMPKMGTYFASGMLGYIIRCFLVLVAIAGFCVATIVSMDNLGIQAIDDVRTELILAYSLMGVCICMLMVGGMAMPGSLLKVAATARRTVASRASRATGQLDPSLEGASTRNLLMVMVGALGVISSAVWLFFLVSKDHSDYARFSFLVTIAVFVAGIFMCHAYMDDPNAFTATGYSSLSTAAKINVAMNHVMRFLIIMGSFSAFAYVLSIVSLCSGTAL